MWLWCVASAADALLFEERVIFTALGAICFGEPSSATVALLFVAFFADNATTF
jgi:hypothetical protein